MSNIKANRNNYSNFERYDNLRVQLPSCSPPIRKEKSQIRENLGAFSIQAAVRYPFGPCYGRPNCVYSILPGVM